eukprot:Gb_33131 [translate_table: standard]
MTKKRRTRTHSAVHGERKYMDSFLVIHIACPSRFETIKCFGRDSGTYSSNNIRRAKDPIPPFRDAHTMEEIVDAEFASFPIPLSNSVCCMEHRPKFQSHGAKVAATRSPLHASVLKNSLSGASYDGSHLRHGFD